MKMHECPKFNTCSAPLCPLDPDWRIRAPHGRTCPFVLESVKPDGVVPEELLPHALKFACDPDLPSNVRRTIEVAKATGSRTQRGRQAMARVSKYAGAGTDAK